MMESRNFLDLTVALLVLAAAVFVAVQAFCANGVSAPYYERLEMADASGDIDAARETVESVGVDEADGVARIPASEAAEHVGEEACVEFRVRRSYQSSAGNVFLNEKEDYKEGFSVTIFASSLQSFNDPAAEYLDRDISVCGLIRMYQGRPEIIVREPAQIGILDGRRSGVDPVGSASGERGDVNTVSAGESWDLVGEDVCVRFFVERSYVSSKGNVFLNEKEDYKNGFSVTIFSSAVPLFGDPVAQYDRKDVVVCGLVKMYDGHPEIVLESPSRISLAA